MYHLEDLTDVLGGNAIVEEKEEIAHRVDEDRLRLSPPERPFEHLGLEGEVEAAEFLWPADLDPERYTAFRVPGDAPDASRDAADIPVEEIANVHLHLLGQHIAIPENDLIRESSRILGFKRTGKAVKDRMIVGLWYLLERGAVRREGESIVVG